MASSPRCVVIVHSLVYAFKETPMNDGCHGFGLVRGLASYVALGLHIECLQYT
jgi:hypothetical protein